MKIILKDGLLIAELNGTTVHFCGSRTADGFAAEAASGAYKDSRKIPDEERENIISSILEYTEKSYLNIRFE